MLVELLVFKAAVKPARGKENKASSNVTKLIVLTDIQLFFLSKLSPVVTSRWLVSVVLKKLMPTIFPVLVAKVWGNRCFS